MTREDLDQIRAESKNDDQVVEELFDIINNIESRTCENCRYFSDEILVPKSVGDGLCYQERSLENPVFDDMSCSKWVKK